MRSSTTMTAPSTPPTEAAVRVEMEPGEGEGVLVVVKEVLD